MENENEVIPMTTKELKDFKEATIAAARQEFLREKAAGTNPMASDIKVKTPEMEVDTIISAMAMVCPDNHRVAKDMKDAFMSLGKEMVNFITEEDANQIAKMKRFDIKTEKTKQYQTRNKDIAGVGTNITTFSDGGALIPQILAPKVIELLYNAEALKQAMPNIQQLVNGNLNYPKLISGSSAKYIGENESKTATSPKFVDVTMNVKIAGSEIPISNQSIRYGNGLIEQAVLSDGVKQISLLKDRTLLLTGTGTAKTPKSIFNHCIAAFKNDMSATPTALTVRNDIMKLKTQLEGVNIPFGRPALFMPPAVKTYIRGLMNETTYVTPAYVTDLMTKNELFDVPVITTNQIIDDGYLVTCASASCTAGAVYKDSTNSTQFTVVKTISSKTAFRMINTVTGGIAPAGTTLTKVSGTGDASITTSAYTKTATIMMVDMNMVELGEGMPLRIQFVEFGNYYDSGLGRLVDGHENDKSVFYLQSEHDLILAHPEAVAAITNCTWGF